MMLQIEYPNVGLYTVYRRFQLASGIQRILSIQSLGAYGGFGSLVNGYKTSRWVPEFHKVQLVVTIDLRVEKISSNDMVVRHCQRLHMINRIKLHSKQSGGIFPDSLYGYRRDVVEGVCLIDP